jgi:two-component system sensor kinase FixL
VERVDGRVEAENAAGGGARFVITLPAASARKSQPIAGKHDA